MYRGFQPENDHDETMAGCPRAISGFQYVLHLRLTPCLAFRDKGRYHIKIGGVKRKPPICPRRNERAWDTSNWTELNWEDGQAVDPVYVL